MFIRQSVFSTGVGGLDKFTPTSFWMKDEWAERYCTMLEGKVNFDLSRFPLGL